MTPPRLADRLLELFCAPHRREEVLGDLHEEFAYQVKRVGERRARLRYWRDVLGFFRPRVPLANRRKTEPDTTWGVPTGNRRTPFLTNPIMLRNYFRTAWRNLINNKGYSAINIGGLAVGMAVAMLIGLWVYDELSFNSYYKNHERLAQVMENQTLEQGIQTFGALPIPLSQELRDPLRG